MRNTIVALVAALLFGIGLAVSGMTQPANVQAFLDFAGDWNPALAFVMVGAIAVHTLLFRIIRKRPSPIFSTKFGIPTRRDLDFRLIGGSALFGIGWGLAGFCPGPTITSIPAGSSTTVVFIATMFVGMLSFRMIQKSL